MHRGSSPGAVDLGASRREREYDGAVPGEAQSNALADLRAALEKLDAASEVDAQQYGCRSRDLARPKTIPQEHNACQDPDQRHQVQVEQGSCWRPAGRRSPATRLWRRRCIAPWSRGRPSMPPPPPRHIPLRTSALKGRGRQCRRGGGRRRLLGASSSRPRSRARGGARRAWRALRRPHEKALRQTSRSPPTVAPGSQAPADDERYPPMARARPRTLPTWGVPAPTQRRAAGPTRERWRISALRSSHW
jgi:hypothetical protein